MKCEACIDINKLDLEPVDPEDSHHGGIRYCEVCEAEYYQEYEREIRANNEQALINHPELETI